MVGLEVLAPETIFPLVVDQEYAPEPLPDKLKEELLQSIVVIVEEAMAVGVVVFCPIVIFPVPVQPLALVTKTV